MAMSHAYIDQYWEQGYAVLRGLLPRAAVGDLQAETRRIYEEGLKHPTTYRDRNLLFEILPESFRGRRYVLQAIGCPGSAPISSDCGGRSPVAVP